MYPRYTRSAMLHAKLAIDVVYYILFPHCRLNSPYTEDRKWTIINLLCKLTASTSGVSTYVRDYQDDDPLPTTP